MLVRKFAKNIAGALCALFLLASPAAQAEQGYLEYLPDVPLMDGMGELEDYSFMFDKAEGRVIETAAFVAVSSESEVMDFYAGALPQLGWVPISRDRFLRNGEQLIVKSEKVEGGVLARFWLSPKQD